MKILISIFSICMARSLSRHVQPKVQLYSMETGRHLAISHRRIGSTRKSDSVLAEIEMISISGSEFIIKGTTTGLYIATTQATQASKQRKLKLTGEKEQATVFEEELIASNQFNKYKISQSDDCFLTMRKNGKPKISCTKNVKNISFLPRKVHRRNYRGQHL